MWFPCKINIIYAHTWLLCRQLLFFWQKKNVRKMVNKVIDVGCHDDNRPPQEGVSRHLQAKSIKFHSCLKFKEFSSFGLPNSHNPIISIKFDCRARKPLKLGTVIEVLLRSMLYEGWWWYEWWRYDGVMVWMMMVWCGDGMNDDGMMWWWYDVMMVWMMMVWCGDGMNDDGMMGWWYEWWWYDVVMVWMMMVWCGDGMMWWWYEWWW